MSTQDARTIVPQRRMARRRLARLGWAGEKSDFFSILLETQESVVYNAPDGEASVLLVR